MLPFFCGKISVKCVSGDSLVHKSVTFLGTISKWRLSAFIIPAAVPIVIPAKARKIFDIKQGDNLLVLGDEGQGIALMKEENLLQMLNVADGED